MIEKWRTGAHVVYAQRRQRAGESTFKRLCSFFFYRVLSRLTDVVIPPDTGDFRLMDRRVVLAFRQCRENPRFVRGLVSWVGFNQVSLPYDREERHAGQTKYDFKKLLRLSMDAFTAFSLKPLKLMMWVGMIVVILSIGLTIPVLIDKFSGRLQAGYALQTCGIFFLGGVQLVMLGIMAHYIGQIFQRGQGRPMYIVAEESADAPPHTSPDIIVSRRESMSRV
jgi:dolichol-phosphate mannosyltransferase